ncbi:hypothetical protein BC829DRAFT_238798 [Chytridium lagenaria]|nr:hypothetical protein BC829DRAFT_238798 [Chytridium lagenaria]
MKKGSRDEYLVQKEREPANRDGFGAGTSHPKSWGWATMLPTSKLQDALSPDGTFTIYAEVIWYQRRGAMAKIMDRLSQGAEPSSQRLLFNDTLADVIFAVYAPDPNDTGDEDLSGDSEDLGDDVEPITGFGCKDTSSFDGGGSDAQGFAVDVVTKDFALFEVGRNRKKRPSSQPQNFGEPDDTEESDHHDGGNGPSSAGSSAAASSAHLPFWQSPELSLPAPNVKRRRLETSVPINSVLPVDDATAALLCDAALAVSPSLLPPLTRKRRPTNHTQHCTFIPAHRSILASRSDYYFAMFSCGLNESAAVFPSQSIIPSSAATPHVHFATSPASFAVPLSVTPHMEPPTPSIVRPILSTRHLSQDHPRTPDVDPHATPPPSSSSSRDPRHRSSSSSSVSTDTAVTPSTPFISAKLPVFSNVATTTSPVPSPLAITVATAGKVAATGAIEIEIRDFSVEAIKIMLEFIYMGRLAKIPETKEMRFELIRVADRYQIPGLHCYISGLIFETDLEVDTAVEILELADKYSSVGTELKMLCLSFIAENLTRLKHSKEFMGWVRSTEHRDLLVEVVQML